MTDLRRLAEAATHHVEPESWYYWLTNLLRNKTAGRDYIAAASPPVILALLDRLDALEAVAEAAREVAFVYVEPVMDEDLPALRAALARLDSLTEVTK